MNLPNRNRSEFVDGLLVGLFRLSADELLHDLPVLQQDHGRNAADLEPGGEHRLHVDVDRADEKVGCRCSL